MRDAVVHVGLALATKALLYGFVLVELEAVC